MADSTQNGPMPGGAGGGAVVRSCRAWGPGPAAVLLRRRAGGPAGGMAAGPARPGAGRGEQLSLSDRKRAVGVPPLLKMAELKVIQCASICISQIHRIC